MSVWPGPGDMPIKAHNFYCFTKCFCSGRKEKRVNVGSFSTGLLSGSHSFSRRVMLVVDFLLFFRVVVLESSGSDFECAWLRGVRSHKVI